MKNIRHIKFLTFTAVALIFLLQVVWIVNVFRLTQKQIFNQVNIDFEENHTGLEDIKIELEIFKYCKGKKAIFPINIQPTWRDFAKLES